MTPEGLGIVLTAVATVIFGALNWWRDARKERRERETHEDSAEDRRLAAERAAAQLQIDRWATWSARIEAALSDCEDRTQHQDGRIADQEQRIRTLERENADCLKRVADLDFQVRSLTQALRAYQRDTPPGGTRRPDVFGDEG